MKITKSQLKQLIKEESRKILAEQKKFSSIEELVGALIDDPFGIDSASTRVLMHAATAARYLGFITTEEFEQHYSQAAEQDDDLNYYTGFVVLDGEKFFEVRHPHNV